VSRAITDSHIPHVELPLNEQEKKQAQHALEELLLSPPLRATAQCQQLLRYIVEHTLDGSFVLLRERIIGKEVFGRQPDYEPGEDPVVRIRAADLRKRLALYYQTVPDAPEPRIEIPPGSYRATFTWLPEKNRGSETDLLPTNLVAHRVPLQSSVVQPNPTESSPVYAPTAPTDAWSLVGRRSSVFLAAFALAIVIAMAWAVRWYSRWSNDLVRQFWASMVASPRPVLISIGSNAVYRIGEHEMDSYLLKQGRDREAMDGMEIYPPLQPDQSFGSTGLYAAPNSFVALGDVAAVSEVVRTLTRYGKDIEERFPSDISFGEVHEHPSVLIGGANNAMTKELTKNLPFVRRGRNWIEDRDHPDKGWELKASGDLHDTDDYAIITRLAGKDDVSPMISVAGLGAHGTLAAAEFLCGPEQVQSLRDRLGPDWLKHNFQLVIRVKIVDFKPASTEIVASREW
jgi:hypothetical protein